MDLHEIFEKHNDEYLKFERIAEPRHRRRDVAAFLMLDELSPAADGKPHDMVAYAAHDEITLAAEPELVVANATEAQVIDLIRCGVRFDASNDCFCMFV